MKAVRLSKSSITQREIKAVSDVLEKEYLGMGNEVQLFENKIKEYLQTKMHVACVNSGTAALHLALNALNLKKGDEVLVPSITYVASYQAITATGATPISCDVSSDTLFIDYEDLKSKIGSKTKAIMPVHHSSSSKGMDKVYELAEKYDLRVVEDAAQAFGSRRNGDMVGKFGDIICFSFDGIKNITCGEGGAILSMDTKLISNIKDSRLLGVFRDTEKRYSGQRSWDFDVFNQGYRYHMSNIMAAIGIVQIDRINDFANKRRKIVKQYLEGLKNTPQVSFFKLNYEEILPHIFVIKVKNRNSLRKYMLNNGIEVGIHYKPNHLLTKFTNNKKLINSEKLYNCILTLPLHYDLKYSEVAHVIKTIIKFYNSNDR